MYPFNPDPKGKPRNPCSRCGTPTTRTTRPCVTCEGIELAEEIRKEMKLPPGYVFLAPTGQPVILPDPGFMLLNEPCTCGSLMVRVTLPDGRELRPVCPRMCDGEECVNASL